MNKKKSLGIFFEKLERLNDEKAKDTKTLNNKKAAYKRKHQESCLYEGENLQQQVIHIFQAHFVQYVAANCPTNI